MHRNKSFCWLVRAAGSGFEVTGTMTSRSRDEHSSIGGGEVMVDVLRWMARVALLGSICVSAPAVLWAADPVVSNVRAQQLADRKVEVLYDLSGAPAGGATVSVAFSQDGGASYPISPAASALSGHVGPGVANGSNRRIAWNAAATMPAEFYATTMRAAVTAVDPGGGGGDEITVTLPGGVPLVLVRIPAGTFMMGSPADERGRWSNEDLHQVTLTQDYYLGKYEVTQRQWQAVMGTNPSNFSSCGLDCPVERVSWNAICGGTTGSTCTSESFIGRLNAHLGTTKFRLPTEAEWERAARAGTTTEFSFAAPATWDEGCGSFPEALPYMWWCGNNSPNGTKPVGSKQPNGYGLYDMHGNVWEWVADWTTASLGTSPVTDPTGPASGSGRVFRGGYWGNSAQRCRSASRANNNPSHTSHLIGFRLARSP